MGHEKELRQTMTLPEKILWYALRDRRLSGYKFRRQAPKGHYILDFVCHERRLVVEVDGGQHNGSLKDAERDQWLNKQGYRVLRFWNPEVLKNLEGVLWRIEEALREGGGVTAPSPGLRPVLSPSGERDLGG